MSKGWWYLSAVPRSHAWRHRPVRASFGRWWGSLKNGQLQLTGTMSFRSWAEVKHRRTIKLHSPATQTLTFSQLCCGPHPHGAEHACTRAAPRNAKEYGGVVSLGGRAGRHGCARDSATLRALSREPCRLTGASSGGRASGPLTMALFRWRRADVTSCRHHQAQDHHWQFLGIQAEKGQGDTAPYGSHRAPCFTALGSA